MTPEVPEVPEAASPARLPTPSPGSSAALTEKRRKSSKKDAVRKFRNGNHGVCFGSNGDGEGVSEATMERLTQTLKVDLPTQYDSPQDLSIFDDGVEFQDPVTRLCGKRRYRGMLFATLLFFRVACRPGSSYFKVLEIDRSTRQTIRTVWETGAIIWNGRELFISGVDTFTVNGEGLITRHDSAWDQSWEQVQKQVIP